MGYQRLPKVMAALALGTALILGACTRSASTPPPAVGSTEASPSGLTAQQQTMEAVRSDLLTQTAQAAGAGEPTEAPTETPEPTSASAATSAATPTTGVIATAGVPSSYTLKQGEHPYCIARRFDIDPIQLLAVNGIGSDTVISPGLTLTIPQGTSGFPPPRALRSHPATYTVQSGDTIYGIACLYGDVDPLAIAQANGLSEPYNLSAGTVLNIP
ncbi:MAG TPA: LysM peptidoglycan-binding domain-containing protein [Anaerolineales bacterium]|jgi:LysM repeat protein